MSFLNVNGVVFVILEENLYFKFKVGFKNGRKQLESEMEGTTWDGKRQKETIKEKKNIFGQLKSELSPNSYYIR